MGVEKININGLDIAYELLGDKGAPAVALTPGGRFPMVTAGLKETGLALAKGGKRVLLWDRPNTGQSDVCLTGDSESGVNGRTLAGLIRELDLGPPALAAGSAGSRVSMIAAASAPDLISHMVLWWISGGPIGLMGLVTHYYGEPANLIMQEGIEALQKAYSFSDYMANNAKARETLLAQDPFELIEQMQKWAAGFVAPEGSPVPGMKPEDFQKFKMPILIFRSGKSDVPHTRRTSEWVHELIPQSKIIDPPWGDREWIERGQDVRSGKEKGLFVRWPLLAPYILDFTKS